MQRLEVPERIARKFITAVSHNGIAIIRVPHQLKMEQARNLLVRLGQLLGKPMPFPNGTLVQSLLIRDPFASTSLANCSLTEMPYQDLPLHTDGTFSHQIPDWIGLVKTDEGHSKGGESICLRAEDWDELEYFMSHPLARQPVVWRRPNTSKLSRNKADQARGPTRPIFAMSEEKVGCRFAKHCISSTDHQGDEYKRFYEQMESSLMSSSQVKEFELEVGDMYFVDNRHVLHGRRRFLPNRKLLREVARIRGMFSK